MGFFSWKSAISKTSIPAFPYAGKRQSLSDVVAILPDDRTIKGLYDGYGRINGIDIFEPIAPYYFTKKKKPTRDDVFNNNKYIESPDGKQMYTAKQFRWDEPIQKLNGMSLNQLRDAGWKIWQDYDKIMEMIKIVRKNEYKGQKYNELPTSERCPDQGFFY